LTEGTGEAMTIVDAFIVVVFLAGALFFAYGISCAIGGEGVATRRLIENLLWDRDVTASLRARLGNIR
jgi:hypothetical protein